LTNVIVDVGQCDSTIAVGLEENGSSRALITDGDLKTSGVRLREFKTTGIDHVDYAQLPRHKGERRLHD